MISRSKLASWIEWGLYFVALLCLLALYSLIAAPMNDPMPAWLKWIVEVVR